MTQKTQWQAVHMIISFRELIIQSKSHGSSDYLWLSNCPNLSVLSSYSYNFQTTHSFLFNFPTRFMVVELHLVAEVSRWR